MLHSCLQFYLNLTMQWLNEPLKWSEEGGIIQVTASQNTDFWRKTHYGFIRDNGHFFFETVTGDFIASAKISGKYEDLYDQAGLMIRLNKENWLKCGIELVKGIQCASTVVTRDYSDWSMVAISNNPDAVWLRVIRQDEAIKIYYSLDNAEYKLMRIAYLTANEELAVGMMCAAPEGNGFVTVFEQFKIQPCLSAEAIASANY